MKRKLFFFYGCCLIVASVSIVALTSFFVKVKEDTNAMVNSKAVFTGINDLTINSNQSEVKVTTKNIENITTTTADCNYSIQVTGTTKIKIIESGVSVVKRGGVGSKNFAGRLSGSVYKTKISGLAPGSIYIVRAYAVSSSETVYGNELTFETKPK